MTFLVMPLRLSQMTVLLVADISFQVPCHCCHSWNVVKNRVCCSACLEEVFRYGLQGKANVLTHSSRAVFKLMGCVLPRVYIIR